MSVAKSAPQKVVPYFMMISTCKFRFRTRSSTYLHTVYSHLSCFISRRLEHNLSEVYVRVQHYPTCISLLYKISRPTIFTLDRIAESYGETRKTNTLTTSFAIDAMNQTS